MSRLAYFVLITEKDEEGFIPLVAKIDETGYFRTSWRWHCTFEQAEEGVKKLNNSLGLDEVETMRIISSSMNRIRNLQS